MYKKWFSLVFWLIVAIGIHFFSMDKTRVETLFTSQIYRQISLLLRIMFGWLPFSAGDVLYGIAVVWLLYKLIKFIQRFKMKTFSGEYFLSGMMVFMRLVFIIYVAFNVLWGINYNRIGIGEQLGISITSYSTDELKTINDILLKKVNESKFICLQKFIPPMKPTEIFSQSAAAYKNLSDNLPYLKYKVVSVKSSMWGWLGNYLGFGGYYNPFTGEAQVNTSVPDFLQPFTTCHEIAHQLGYAKEDEANFVGYLAASNSTDPRLNYSVYLDMFMYANRNLVEVDTTAAKNVSNNLLPAVKADIQQWRAFNQQHKNPVAPIINWLYGKFLQGNEQPAGLLSYDEVTGFIIAYHKKYGKI